MTTYAPDSAAEQDDQFEIDPQRRVKMYRLLDNGQWAELATGYASTDYELQADCIIVKSEVDETVLLTSPIRPVPEEYSRQQETLIMWVELDGKEIALSFQLQESCAEVWDEIQKVQSNLLAQEDGSFQIEQEVIQLPDPSMANVRDIEMMFSNAARSIFFKEPIIRSLAESRYLPKLMNLFNTCEDLEAVQELNSIGNIMRSIILLNDTAIYEFILKDENFLTVIGMLEYDREYPQAHATYRNHLTQKAKFKQVVPIENEHIIAKIQQTFKIMFLKDVALARMLDDGGYSTLNSLVYFNNVEIVNYFRQDHPYLDKLFTIMNSDEPIDRKKQVVLFLTELCNTAKTLQIEEKSEFYKSLGNHGLFSIFEYTLADPDISTRIAAAAILCNILEHDPSLIRNFSLDQSKNAKITIVELVIQRFHNEPDSGLQLQLTEILRMILDIGLINAADVKMAESVNSFLLVFYEKYVKLLFSHVLEFKPVHQDNMVVLSSHKQGLMAHSCELLCFMIKTHTYHSKYFILGTPIIQNLLFLFKARDTFVKLAALRVLRTCIGTLDEFYNRHLLRYSVFNSVFELLQSTSGKYNMLNSACLELFDFINREKIQSLQSHICTVHFKTISELTYTSVFQAFMDNFQATNTSAQPQTKDGFAKIDAQEEAYFNSEDESSEPSASPVTRHEHTMLTSPIQSKILFEPKSPLVDYDNSDEDDEPFGRKIQKKTLTIKAIDKRISEQDANAIAVGKKQRSE